MRSRRPEFGNGTPPPSRIIEQIIDPEEIASGDLLPHERELLEKPVLGKNSHGEALFRHFADTVRLDERPRGINRLRIRILPSGLTPPEIRMARNEDNNEILIFNDKFAGHSLELQHTQEHGVWSMTLADNAEPQPYVPAAGGPDADSYPEIGLIDSNIDSNSTVSIIKMRSGHVVLKAVVQGELVEARINERAELGFSEICDQLLWSPSFSVLKKS